MDFEQYLQEELLKRIYYGKGSKFQKGDHVTHRDHASGAHYQGIVTGHTIDREGKRLVSLQVHHSPNNSAKEGAFKDHYEHELKHGQH